MSNHEANDGTWNSRRARLKGTPLEAGRPLSPSQFNHLLAGCAYEPGEIIGTPAFIEVFMQSGSFQRDLAAHLARVDVEYVPWMNRECLQTNNADENFLFTIEGEVTLCMLRTEVGPIADRLSSDAFSEICALSPEARRPELDAWLQRVCEEAESYDDDIYWNDDCEEE